VVLFVVYRHDCSPAQGQPTAEWLRIRVLIGLWAVLLALQIALPAIFLHYFGPFADETCAMPHPLRYP